MYWDGPARYLRPIAEALAVIEPANREMRLSTRIGRLEGQTPSEVLEGGDPGRLSRFFVPSPLLSMAQMTSAFYARSILA